MAQKAKGGLRREIGLFAAVAIGAGAVLGGGPFVLAAKASEMTGSSVWLAYLIIGLPLITVALAYGALGSAMPQEGGTYYYPTRLLSPFWGFLSGWARWLAYITPLALTAFVFSDHIQTVAPAIPAALLMVVFIAFFYILNVLGIKISAMAQMIMFGILVAGFLVFSFAGLPSMNAEYFKPMQPFGWGGTLTAAALLFFCYVGFTAIAEVGEEIKRPARTIPLGMIIAILVCITIYVFFSIVASGNLLWSEQAASATPILDAAKVIMPALAGVFLLVIVMAVATSQNGFQIAASRVVLTLGRDRVIPSWLGSTNERFGTPVWALTVSCLIALFFIFYGKSLVFACYCSNITFLFSYIIVMFAAMVLHKRKPELYEKAPFKLKGAWIYVLPIIAIIVAATFIALQEPKAMLWSAVWLAAGAIWYFVRKYQLKREGVKLENLLKRMPEEMT